MQPNLEVIAYRQGLTPALIGRLTRLSGTLALVASEGQVQFRHFRLAGTRDYALPPERCVEVEEDGVTLAVDLSRSDLMLETELPRFADLVERATPASLGRARAEGLTIASLEAWFTQRTGEAVTPAARLLLTGAQLPAPGLRRHLVLHVETAEIADGLTQWPGTRGLIAERLGPTSLSIADEQLEALTRVLREIGVEVGPGWCLSDARTIRISCRGRLQDLHAARNQDGGPGQLHPLVRRL